MDILEGIVLTPGIAISTAIVQISKAVPTIPRYKIGKDQHESELRRLDSAIHGSLRELQVVLYRHSVLPHEREIIETHIEMLKDITLRNTVEEYLRERSENVEAIVHDYIDELSTTLAQVDDEYLRERAVDFYDISRRILSQLLYYTPVPFSLKDDAILVAHELTPSEFIHLDKNKLRGLILEVGGKNSHTAILARSFRIPSLVGLSDICLRLKSGTPIILDGNEGKVIAHPSAAIIRKYELLQTQEQERREAQIAQEILPSVTKDGVAISLMANIEFPDEVEDLHRHQVAGVGLFRSEFLFIGKYEWPDEDEQYRAYQYVLSQMRGQSVVIRTLDIGGDKLSPGVRESNPIMGWRAVRFSLAHRSMFRVQLRALLRASTAGKLKILIPMISNMEEVHDVLHYLESIKEELREEGIPFDPQIPIGAMIEVPSAALIVEDMAGKVDFLSIGTNDLVQYTLAVDRGNEYVAYLYNHFHPSIIRLIHQIITSANRKNIPIEICGEMAGGIQEVPLLIGMGLRTFSMSPVHLPAIRQTVRRITLSQAEKLVEKVLRESSIDEIYHQLKEFSYSFDPSHGH